MIGKIRRLISDRGFGFINDGTRKDVFLHASEYDGEWDALKVGSTVEFDLEETPKGPAARNVKLQAS